MPINSINSIAIYPSQGERLEGYIDRCSVVVSQLEGWSSGHVSWFTHYGPGSCWICDCLLQARNMIDIMAELCKSDKKHKYVAEHPKGSTNPQYFVFKPVLK